MSNIRIVFSSELEEHILYLQKEGYKIYKITRLDLFYEPGEEEKFIVQYGKKDIKNKMFF